MLHDNHDVTGMRACMLSMMPGHLLPSPLCHLRPAAAAAGRVGLPPACSSTALSQCLQQVKDK